MKRFNALFSLLTLLAILLTACTLSSSSDDTPQPLPTATPDALPTVDALPTPLATAAPVTLNAFFGAPEGQSSPYGPIGCDSYLVPVPLADVPADLPTDQQITTALNALFGVTEQLYTESQLFNPLALSSLAVSSVGVDANGAATIALSGDVMLSGVCADAIFAAQIETTAQQISGVTATTITINGALLADVISGRGD